jgi:hypothetical protein
MPISNTPELPLSRTLLTPNPMSNSEPLSSELSQLESPSPPPQVRLESNPSTPTASTTIPSSLRKGALKRPASLGPNLNNSNLQPSSQRRRVHDTYSPSTTSNAERLETQTSQRRSYQNSEQKLLGILRDIKSRDWTLQRFLKELLLYKEQKTVTAKYILRAGRTAFKTFAYKTAFEENLLGFAKLDWKTFVTDSRLPTQVGMIIKKELETLLEFPSFRDLDIESDPNNLRVDTLGDLKQAQEHVVQRCPVLVEILSAATTTLYTRDKAAEDIADNETLDTAAAQNHALRLKLMDSKLFMIAAIMGGRLHAGRFNGVQLTLGLYLYQGGARKRVIDTFARLGICKGFITIRDRYQALTNAGREEVRKMGQLSTAIAVYDNFDFAVNKRDEAIGDKRKFESIATCVVLQGIEMPVGGLTQDMWHPERPLPMLVVMDSISRDAIFYEVSRCPARKRYTN